MATISITKSVNRMAVSAQELAADYVYRGLDLREAWNQFIMDRSLRPEIDIKALGKIMKTVSPCPLETIRVIEFNPTHQDTFLEVRCEIARNEGYMGIVWETGMTGSYPLAFAEYDDFNSRYVPL